MSQEEIYRKALEDADRELRKHLGPVHPARLAVAALAGEKSALVP